MSDQFIGPMFIHCHILSHEDSGMMMVVETVPQGLLLRILATTVSANPDKIRTFLSVSLAPAQECSVIPLSTGVNFYTKLEFTLATNRVRIIR